MEIPDIIKLVYSKVKNQDPWKFHIIFSWSPEKLWLFFNWALEFAHAISSIRLEIPCPQPSLFGFFWNSPLVMVYAGICGRMQLMFTTWRRYKHSACRYLQSLKFQVVRNPNSGTETFYMVTCDNFKQSRIQCLIYLLQLNSSGLYPVQW